MSKPIRIGTRDSELALWQARTVQKQLEAHGFETTLVPVKATGDLLLDKPLYELGITGIFTKTLDVAMLSGTVDIAVHSMKDVPTALPRGIVQAAVLERAATGDILVRKDTTAPDYKQPCTIATGSLRRQAQWLHRYPHHQTTDLRGNVNTRLQKVRDHDWTGAIFAMAGLERIALLPDTYESLDWMIPAPAQGAMMVVALEKDTAIREACALLNHDPTATAVQIERDFLRTLEGGCTAPIGALATHEKEKIRFKGILTALDGSSCVEIERTVAFAEAEDFGKHCATELLERGGASLMRTIRSQMPSK